ncbi:MAG: transporter substrate-binding domain-containing protein, partial [Anaerolineaceae bacterium]
TYKPYATFEQAFLDLANGQIDAVIADNPIARGFIKNNSDQLMTVGDVFTNESYGIAFCKNRQDLLNQVNPALQAVIADGVVDQLKAKYFTGE